MTEPRHDLTLEVETLAVERGERIVVAGVGFTLAPGQGLTLRGANGTGKTSILRAVAGFARPAEGDIRFRQAGAPLDPAETRATQIHWLGGDDALADKLSVTESLAFWAGLYDGAVAPDLIATLGLDGLDHAPLGKLSTGQRRRCALGRLIAAPRALWLLDEPMSGLDDEGREVLARMIAEHRGAGGLVLMASHDQSVEGCPVLRLRPQGAAA